MLIAIRTVLRVLAITAVAACIRSCFRAHWPFRVNRARSTGHVPAPRPPNIDVGGQGESTEDDGDGVVSYLKLVPPIAPERWRCSDSFTELGRRVVARAHLQAYAHHSDHIGTDHVLLALIDDQHDAIMDLLREAGIDAEDLRRRIEDAIGPAQSPRAAHLPFSPHVKRALAFGLRAAQRQGRALIDVEHIVAGVFSQPDSAASRFVVDLGVSAEWLRRDAVPGAGSSARPRNVS